MKFKYYLEKINNAEIYPMLSLIIFGLIFLGVLVYVFTSDKKNMNDKANIPLQ
ncbi:MAG: CcoQ/FixQ family Cbb3-type cytochrome c oxidase assembly chaperone [Chitinophagaceae bacterium]|jgi:cbb3-type cytochrome oxidase subunit 3|nr:CcoQ/FixQ family Cbb3-type cytochrome c oxidase assembly chaperone [Chitinophagaceae bacterium]